MSGLPPWSGGVAHVGHYFGSSILMAPSFAGACGEGRGRFGWEGYNTVYANAYVCGVSVFVFFCILHGTYGMVICLWFVLKKR